METLFKRILIATDLSEVDEQLFSFTEELTRKIAVQKIYLVHIIPNFRKSQMVDLDFHKQFTTAYPIDEKVKDLLTEKIKDHFIDREIKFTIDVVEGQPYQKLLHWIELKEVDLVVVGAKKRSLSSGITAKRLARKTKANILFVSDQSTTDLKTILVPVDFSESSAKALKTAIDLKKKSEQEIRIKALHVVEVLAMGNYYGLSLNYKYLNTLVENSKKSFDQFLENHEIDSNEIEKVVVPNDYNNVSQHIQAYIRDEAADMIIIGATGHSAFDRFLYGSVTEQLVNEDLGKPILIIR